MSGIGYVKGAEGTGMDRLPIVRNRNLSRIGLPYHADELVEVAFALQPRIPAPGRTGIIDAQVFVITQTIVNKSDAKDIDVET